MPEELTNNIPSKPEPATNWAELDVRSEEVQEIIGRPPHWLIRWGVLAFFGVLLLVLLSASIIKYPEGIQAPIKLAAIEAPRVLQSRIDGKLVKISHENNVFVHQGDVLAWMESIADHEEVLRLTAETDSMRFWLARGEPGNLNNVSLSGYNDLGELQTAFQSFEQSFREFLSFLPGGFYTEQKKFLEQEIQFNKLLYEKLVEQKEIQEADLDLALQEYEMQKQLAENDYIAPIELARAESELSSRRLPLQQTESSLINNQVSQAAKQKEMMELEKQMAEQESVFLQALNGMKSAIEEWKRTSLITAPYDGKVVYAGILQENQSVSPGQEIFYIQPENTEFFGEMSISQGSFGKVEEGQSVMIRFNSYPYHEFGTVYGEIEYLSDFPVRDSLFFARVNFPEGLTTNYGQRLTPRNGMTGQAEIITKDMRLLERVYNNMTKELR
ncbi:MAG: HlyD family efflux transporter periplasmic adaptor subunit [Balneolaceae bacterium]